jgi:Zn-dependent alcohol dehydrogenase
VKTRAAIHVEHGKPLVVDEIDLPDPGPAQVVVRQFASGICHSQLHQLNNPASRTPLVLGHESTGVVLAAGSSVRHVREGDRVIITWIPRNSSEGGVRPPPTRLLFNSDSINAGVFTWSEVTIVDQMYVVPLSLEAPADLASVIGCAVMTGCGAVINTAGVSQGQSVAVLGVGGVGLCIVQAAANVGASHVVAVDLSDDKLDYARRFGATSCINATREDPVVRIRESLNGGVDFAFDAVGVPTTMEQVLAAVRPGVGGVREGGTAVLVGVPQTAATLNMRDLFSGRTYRGSLGGSCRPDRDFPVFLDWYAKGKLPLDLLVTRRYRLEDINSACQSLERGEITGRAIIDFS